MEIGVEGFEIRPFINDVQTVCRFVALDNIVTLRSSRVWRTVLPEDLPQPVAGYCFLHTVRSQIENLDPLARRACEVLFRQIQ